MWKCLHFVEVQPLLERSFGTQRLATAVPEAVLYLKFLESQASSSSVGNVLEFVEQRVVVQSSVRSQPLLAMPSGKGTSKASMP